MLGWAQLVPQSTNGKSPPVLSFPRKEWAKLLPWHRTGVGMGETLDNGFHYDGSESDIMQH